MPMKWRTITKKEAEDIFEKWDERPTVDCDPEFMRLRTDLLNELNKIRDKLAIVPEPDNRLGYEFDLQFGLVFYQVLVDRFSFTQRLASDDGVWRYLSMRVLPDIVNLRYGLRPQRFYGTPRRIWLKAIWWYIHLSWQGNIDDTYRILEKNTTDDIVQIVERPGPHGYRVELLRALMREYHYVRSTHTVEHRLLRKVMVLNTTRLSVIEPSLCADGEVGYVKELFKYFGYSDEQVTTGHRSFFGLRWPFTRVSSGRV